MPCSVLTPCSELYLYERLATHDVLSCTLGAHHHVVGTPPSLRASDASPAAKPLNSGLPTAREVRKTKVSKRQVREQFEADMSSVFSSRVERAPRAEAART